MSNELVASYPSLQDGYHSGYQTSRSINTTNIEICEIWWLQNMYGQSIPLSLFQISCQDLEPWYHAIPLFLVRVSCVDTDTLLRNINNVLVVFREKYWLWIGQQKIFLMH